MPTAAMHRVDTVMTGPPGGPFYSRQFFEASAATATAHAAQVRTFWDSVKGVIASGTTINVQPTVYTVDPVSGDITSSELIATPSAVGGAAADEKMPFANQGILNWYTGVFLGGRQLRGRTFIPSMTQAANNAGETITAYRNTIDAAATIMSVNGHCVYSPTFNRWEYVTVKQTAFKIGVLRSRRD